MGRSRAIGGLWGADDVNTSNDERTRVCAKVTMFTTRCCVTSELDVEAPAARESQGVSECADGGPLQFHQWFGGTFSYPPRLVASTGGERAHFETCLVMTPVEINRRIARRRDGSVRLVVTRHRTGDENDECRDACRRATSQHVQ